MRNSEKFLKKNWSIHFKAKVFKLRTIFGYLAHTNVGGCLRAMAFVSLLYKNERKWKKLR